ncbi:MAG: MATE family efflux transporter [Clostridia bacterium]|nr:MATE family efflux transporter [Clostridia bacterium]
MKNTKTISKDFTSGTIWMQLILFALPFMASNALQVFYSTIDMIIVGRYVGTAGIAAVSQSSQIVNFATMVCLGFSNAGQVLLAQAMGAGKRKEMNDVIGTLFVYIGGVSVVLSVIMLTGSSFILGLLNVKDDYFEMAKSYLVICALGLLFTAGYNLVSAVLRGMGDAKRPFLFIVIASVTNLVLDILFTGIFGWGVMGAALATVIGQAVSFIFSIFYLAKKKAEFGFDFKRESFIPKKRYVRMITSLGTPMAIQSGFINLSMLTVNAMINDISTVASATFGVGIRIDDIINKISMGVQYAAVPMISQNLGAKNHERAKSVVHWAWIFSVALTVFFMVLYVTLGRQLFMIFDDNPDVLSMSGDFISAILWMFPAFAIMRGSGAFVQGIGNAKLSMILSVLDGVVLRIGLSWLFGIALGFGFYGFVLGYALAPFGYAIPSTIYFLRGRWQKKRTLAEEI